jgi:CDP-diacylglycerol---glycerol-3-phosphate 3-phosphatidyltransferase
MAATPVVMALVLAIDDHGWAQPAAAVLFAVVSATDFFDGYLARRWGETTTLGTFLDTTSDKLLVSGVLIALVAVGRASSWVAFVIVARELVIMGVRAVVAAEGTVMTPSLWGKLKANVQFIAIFLAILDIDAAVGPWGVDQWALAIAAVVTALSGIDYLVRFWSAFHEPTASGAPTVSQRSVAPKAYDQTRV